MNHLPFLAIDWGTTNRRAYLIDAGSVVTTAQDSMGILSVPPEDFAGEVQRLRARHANVPAILAGMVGSNRGWVDAGYVATPATLATLAGAIVRPADGAIIVPGVSHIDGQRGDVMRGEEMQLLGAVAARLVPDDALLCQPGTHCKWARMKGGALTAFITAMTGEMFSLIKRHALIGQEMDGAVMPGEAFVEGVRDGAKGDLLGALFGVRPASLLHLRDRTDAASFVSGLLIGADCAVHAGREQVYLLADPVLGALYAKAIDTLGGYAILVDSHAAFVAGVTRLWELTS